MHIALMEDVSIVEILTFALNKQGHTTQSFPDTLPCIAACVDSSAFDLLITEIKLPWSNIDGHDAIRLIQKYRPLFPGILLSVFDKAQIAALSSGLMNVSILQKPFCFAQLCAKLPQRNEPSSEPSTPQCKPRWLPPQSGQQSA